jgi:predicted AlkP superfamily pyrophosphatase or phosphodiesterase
MKPTFLWITLLLISANGFTQTTTTSTTAVPTKPKLIVGLVVDQMRWDFLYRYPEKYSSKGFKRLLNEGYSCENTHINYSPSYTACGHTCIYTGSVPSVHGITGNDWFDIPENKTVYCTEDSTQKTIGSNSSAGKMSPKRLLTTTVGDELKLSNNFQSKVIGIALKDRSSILPAGHSANAAYFYDGASGNWITSTYYMTELPTWVTAFNNQKIPEKYLAQNWNTLLPIAQYFESDHDDVSYENPFKNEKAPVFEHKVSELAKPTLDILRATPYGNTLTLNFAKDAIKNESLGKGKYTDFLAVSLSSTDYIGHQFGPNSIEIEDCYIRLDKDLELFFNYLDETIGKGNYLFFLTADHGAAHIPAYLTERKIPAGVLSNDSVMKQLAAQLNTKYGSGDWLLGYENMQLYMNNKLIAEKKVDKQDMKNTIKQFLLTVNGIADILDLENLNNETIHADLKQLVANGVHKNRSGELFILHNPGWFEGYAKGTTHGTIYPYDTHIPLVWMGWKIPHKADYTYINMSDIAPTISSMLHIQEPNGSVGKVIEGIFKK